MADVRSGSEQVHGDVAHGSADAGNPVKQGGKVYAEFPTTRAAGDRTDAWFDELGCQVVRPFDRGLPSYYAVYDRIAPAANKYMATLFNTSSTRKAVVTHVWAFNWQVSAVTGVLLEHYLARITARTAGSAVTVRAQDTGDTLSAGITADTLSTAVTEDHVIERFFAASEEMVLAASGITLGQAGDRSFSLVWEREAGQRGLVLRQNQGVSVRCVTSSTVGTVSYLIELLDLPA